MGGNAFGVPAQRLAQPQYDRLKDHVLNTLSALFKQMETPRNLLSKTDHGDLDVLIGYSDHVQGGDEEWTALTKEDILKIHRSSTDIPTPDPMLEEVIAKLGIKPAGSTASTLIDLSRSNHGGQIQIIGTGKMLSGKEVDDLRELCGKMRECIGATAWRRRGPEVSFKIPCELISGDKGVNIGDDHFYQVDALFVPPENLEFNLMMSSYSSTGLLLGRVLRTLSRSFTLHLTHLIVRHSPYFGIPPIDITLTTSATEFCEWLGLDYQVWKHEGQTWVNESDLWRWMTTAKEDSIAGQAIKRMAKKSRSPVNEEFGGKRRRRADFADRFYDWLQNDSSWVKVLEKEKEEKEKKTAEDQDKTKGEGGKEAATLEVSDPPTPIPVPTPSPGSTPTEIPTQNATLSPNECEKLLSGEADMIPKLTTPKLTDNPSVIDPDQPKPLDSRVIAAIDYWKKQEAYEETLKARKVVAEELAERQRERMERKDKASEDQAKYEAEVKDW
ncbi:uncharacterized protein L201_001557 [Kwoniella dendrophila CBS 6074]|uniref:Uncharacterized protein n=1 Tax=Kwoniella dendrophila CBS 6074 TaxID=1295534 RepID=A0AAX4JMN1_9TREE